MESVKDVRTVDEFKEAMQGACDEVRLGHHVCLEPAPLKSFVSIPTDEWEKQVRASILKDAALRFVFEEIKAFPNDANSAEYWIDTFKKSLNAILDGSKVYATT